MKLLLVLWCAYRAYRQGTTGYAAYCVHGVPQVACFVGIGREAWRVTAKAIGDKT